jgi:hypothetical protein
MASPDAYLGSVGRRIGHYGRNAPAAFGVPGRKLRREIDVRISCPSHNIPDRQDSGSSANWLRASRFGVWAVRPPTIHCDEEECLPLFLVLALVQPVEVHNSVGVVRSSRVVLS